jgi:hypothetical protein
MPAGRPTVMTKEVLGKLEEAFLCDATNDEAAYYAGINPDTLYEYKKNNPKYSEHIKTLRGMTGLKAKANIKKSIESGDKYDSRWYLERRDKDYKPKSKHEVSGNVGLTLLEQIIDDGDKEPEEKDGCRGGCKDVL